MPLIQTNVTLDINYASKQRTCALVQSVGFSEGEMRTNRFTYFRILGYGCDPW